MKKALIFISIFLVFSCNYDLQFYKNIKGSWRCESVVALEGFPCDGYFYSFYEDRSYRIDGNGEELVGAYKIAGNKVHFGQNQVMIQTYRIIDISQDSMWWRGPDDSGIYVTFSRHQ